MATEKEQIKESKEKAAKAKTAKVNMMLPSGTSLVIGEAVTLTKEDESHLVKHFKAEDISKIIE